MPKLSVIIPTYNEDKYLKGALHSVQFADEIIVVDSLSTDKTVEIAEQHGCKVVARAFDNFSNQQDYYSVRSRVNTRSRSNNGRVRGNSNYRSRNDHGYEHQHDHEHHHSHYHYHGHTHYHD